LFVFAALGAVLPWGLLVLILAARDPLPPGCRSGTARLTRPSGQVVYAVGQTLWWAHADLSAPLKLAALSPSPLASSSTIPAAPASGATTISPLPASPSTSATAPATQILAAALSPDRKSVAFVVANSPDEAGKVSLRWAGVGAGAYPVSPVELWSDQHYLASDTSRTEMSWLTPDRLLFRVPYAFPTQQSLPRLVGVASVSSHPALLHSTSESDFLAGAHSAWSETRDLKLPPLQPQLDQRVTNAHDVAGTTDRSFNSPLSRRLLHELAVGRLGGAHPTIACGSADPVQPLLFSPDGKILAVAQEDTTYLLDIPGGPPMTPLVEGRLLDWRS
jgi:hypothetical protein